MTQLALSIDMDGLEQYAAIHGLPTQNLKPAFMYGAPLKRFLDFCDSLNAKATIFVVGRDLEGDAGDDTAEKVAEALRHAASLGHEIGNHSFTHDYALSHKSISEVRADILRAHELLLSQTGICAKGFRCPGYNISPEILDVLEELSYAYDSSALPSPPYYLAKALVLSSYHLRKKSSQAIYGSPRMLLAPRHVYQPGHGPYFRGSSSVADGPLKQRMLKEIPIGVSGPLRIPLSGGILALLSKSIQRLLLSAAGNKACVFNFHGMDFVDARRDGLPTELSAAQPELRKSIGERIQLFQNAVRLVGGDQPNFLTCAELADANLA